MSESLLNRRRIKSLAFVLFSNGITLLAGILSGFLVPKMMSLTDYGYYKIFNLYCNYLPLFHFGLTTGIYLKYGDKNYDELNKSYFRYFFRILFFSQLFISLCLGIVGLFLIPSDYSFIIFALSFVLLSGNITNYFQTISQFTERYKEYSLRNLLYSFLNGSSIVVFFVLYSFNTYILDYRVYLLVIVAINFIMTIWYLFTYKDISFGKIYEKPDKKELFDLFKSGFILIFSGLIAQLILTIDRQFVSILFSTEEYAAYAFSYSLMSLITTFIGAISTVIYPSLKRLNKDKISQTYYESMMTIFVVTSIFINLYFVIVLIVNFYLPKYLQSLGFLYIIIPTVLFSSAINVVTHNFYKVLEKEKTFFFISLAVLALSIVANLCSYFIFKTMEAISWASVGCMFLWYSSTQFFLHRFFKFKWIKNNIFVVVIIVAFYILSKFITLFWLSFIVFFIVSLLLSIMFYYPDLKTLFSSFKKNKNESQI